jgi:hypothetical protein
MARLFIRYEPVECHVAIGLGLNSFKVDARHLTDRGLDICRYSIDPCYVCFVHEGKCYAGRTFNTFTAFGEKIVSVSCVPFNDYSPGQKMILADMILG